MTSIYDIHVTNAEGTSISMADFKGNVLLIVNTASKCGFTPQLIELQELYEKYRKQGFTVLGFPSDDFLTQEFGKSEEIVEYCQVNYGVTFPIFQKVKMKGEHIHPLFAYLTSQQPGLLTKSIKWNFTKFLITREGKVVRRYAPSSSAAEIEKDLKKIL
ncbi:glutathione peroxidase [Bacillus thermotolerans]|uniref:Glutathione peroxidase n=1 Tax=Bacillus thermotolerans TaxID=1221996 RepID=A0A0F5I2I9_BACTR|nr:glutathione peroxidase [Bacillus thermotolerans]KKB33324.1 Glutathione peroxidase family protein [Bacillus thermotolerans]KKB35811.1 Glutathione peroxidase family protein [Bacillus thermotolerans]KKB39362.1 Glutathione peroxidase family protein [Bacillus thermotolerans]